MMNFAYAQNNTQNTAPMPTQAAQQQGPDFMNMILLFAPMFVVIYFFIIRPQNKKMKAHQALLSQVKTGDEILTNAGMFGKVTGVTDKVLTVEIADNVKVKMLKTQVATINPVLK